MAKEYKGYTYILDECKELSVDRGKFYGTAKDNLERTAEVCRAFGLDLKAKDIALIMAANKMARERNVHKHDNLVDMINYLAIYESLT